MRGSVSTIALLLGVAAIARGQTCTDAHYRWAVKTAEALASTTPNRANITAILTTWTIPDLTGQSQFKCADRGGKELKSYVVLGWVRRVVTDESDGDWHVELTSHSDTPVDSCMVVEIPPGALGANYGQARVDLQHRVSWSSSGNVAQPVRLRFIGAAFFDGEHRGGATRRDQTDGNHGHCNSSARALWELHPVYWVKQP